MCEDCWLWAWGAAGAFAFASGAFGLALFSEPYDGTPEAKRHRGLAAWNFTVAIITGCIFAQGFSRPAVDLLAAGVTVNEVRLHMKAPPLAMALFIGWSGNFLWPPIQRRLVRWVNRANPDGDTKS